MTFWGTLQGAEIQRGKNEWSLSPAVPEIAVSWGGAGDIRCGAYRNTRVLKEDGQLSLHLEGPTEGFTDKALGFWGVLEMS